MKILVLNCGSSSLKYQLINMDNEEVMAKGTYERIGEQSFLTHKVNGEKIRLIGQGKQGENGGRNGDLLIKVQLTDLGKFKLKGYDLYTDLLLNPWEAALGTRTSVKSIDEETQIYVPQGIQSGEKLRITGKGYKDGKGGRGDLIIEVKVMVPKQLTEKEKDLFEKLKKISKFNPREMVKS